VSIPLGRASAREPGATLASLLRGVIIVTCLAGSLLAASPATGASRPLRTAIVDPGAYAAADPAPAFALTKSTGARFVRLSMSWARVAPTEPDPMSDPTDPANAAYTWTDFDLQVEQAKAAGLEPIVCIETAPSWAGGLHPDPVKFGAFAEAAARRYSDAAVPPVGKPRVRYWQAWNEPNRDYFLMPQYENGQVVSAAHYRSMVNQFAAGVRDANPTNRVIAGGLAPLGRTGTPAPLSFMKKVLEASVSFDIWAHHPYTSGGPLHRSAGKGDVTLGNLGEMRTLLMSKDSKINNDMPLQFWVTEFSWDSKPPDPDALGQPLHRRWVAEALYRMWSAGVSLVTWFRLEDDPLTGPLGTPYQSGFYTTSGSPKASLQAFRFPTVALTKRGGILVWGRTPGTTATSVTIQIKTGRTWKKLSTLNSNGQGIFTKTYKVPYRKGYIRAKASGQFSVPFSLTYVRDRFVNPFGCGGGIAC